MVGGEAGSGGRGHMYTYSCFTLVYSRNQHTIVKQAASNLKLKKNKNLFYSVLIPKDIPFFFLKGNHPEKTFIARFVKLMPIYQY